MSGHSKWATTKHQKAVKDARRGKEFARLIKNIEVAARTGGGDPSGNPTLYDAIQKAKKTSVPNDNIERARKRGAGEEAGGADWQNITYEGYGPNGVAVLVECLTDNRNRAAGEVRVAMTRNGGNMANPGSVSYRALPQGCGHAGEERPDRGRRADGGARRRRGGRQRPRRQLLWSRTYLSGGCGGKSPALLEGGRTKEATTIAARYREAFGPNFYLELLSHDTPLAAADRRRLASFGQKHGLPLLAASDVHYLEPQQARARDLLWAVADNARLDDPNRRRPVGEDARPLPLEELQRRFAEWPEPLKMPPPWLKPAGYACLKSSLIIPNFPLPPEFAGDDPRQAAARYLESICRQNLNQRFGQPLPEAVEQRLKLEMGVIAGAGFARYILIVADMVRQARAMDILCAPRGSSAGSLVCFAAGITPFNPLDTGCCLNAFSIRPVWPRPILTWILPMRTAPVCLITWCAATAWRNRPYHHPQL